MVDDAVNELIKDEGLNYYKGATSDNALKIRLEVDDTLEKIEMYLRGESYAYDKKGEVIKVQSSKPKANDEGIRAIMNAVTSYINKSAVQGNLTDIELGMVMNDFHRYFANLLGFHCSEWEIDRNQRKSIVNFIEPFVFMYVTRTKENKERESYGMQIREVGRSQIVNQASKRFGIF